jgi:RNA polymerase sigma-70 factor (ECF subfamily)
MHEDAALVYRAKQGDSDAFEALMIRYERAAKVLALGILQDRDLADDVVQNTFIRAYEKLGTLRQGSRFAAWLMRIVKRQAVRAARKRRPMAPLESIAEPMDPIGDEELRHKHECLMELVNRLPLHERLIFALRYLDGHRPSDIAAMTGRPVDTVRKQLSRAMGRLRRWARYEESES